MFERVSGHLEHAFSSLQGPSVAGAGAGGSADAGGVPNVREKSILLVALQKNLEKRFPDETSALSSFLLLINYIFRFALLLLRADSKIYYKYKYNYNILYH